MGDVKLLSIMPNLQVKNVPDDMYERIRWLAKKQNATIRATVLEAVERRIREQEWQERIDKRAAFELDVDAATLIREGRVEAGSD